MSDHKPEFKPRFWIIRAPDGTRSVRVAKMTSVTAADIRYGMLKGCSIEATIEPELTPENQKLFEALVHIDVALEPRTQPHLRDLLGELVLKGYEAGRKIKKGG